jgi:hypothetical protein
VDGRPIGGAGLDIDPATDRAEGEDGYGRALESDGDDAAPWEEGPVSEQYGDGHEADDDYDDGFTGDMSASSTDTPTWSEHDDGEADEPSAMATGMDSVFPAGSQVPAMLEDEEYRDEADVTELSGRRDGELEYEDGFESRDATPFDDGLALQATPAAPAAEPLTTVAKREIIEAVTRVVAAEGFATVVADDEYAGRRGDHPARGQYHLGLSFGIGPFNQSAGHLGQLLMLMQQRDDKKFREVFGPHADALLEVTNRPGVPAAQASDSRGPRVQPVGGDDLWSAGWVKRFRESARPDLFGAGQPQQFNGAQNQLAARLFLEPILPFARRLGLRSKRALAVLLELAMRLGAERAMGWALAAVSPIQGPAQRQQALAAVGVSDVAAFQRAHPGVETTGEWGLLTHAALLAELRALGARSPLPIASREGEMMLAMRRRAAAESWEQRFAALESLPATEYPL